MSTLRYAIVSIILCPLLVSAPLVGFWRRAKTPIRVLALGALVYSFIFSWSAIMIIENNGPQLRYLAGQIDKSTYLKAAFGPYAVVEAVGKAADSGDEILAIDCCAALYSPESWRFHCRRLKGDIDVSLQLRAWLAERSYDFMIVPRQMDVGEEIEALRPVEVYRDSRYAAYRLQPDVSASLASGEDLRAVTRELRGRTGEAPSACAF